MVDRIGHIAFYVNDIEASLEFYSRVFGFPEAFRMTRDDGSVSMVYLYITDSQFIELFPAKTQPQQDGALGTVGSHGEIRGYAHFCFQVADVEAALEKARASGAPIDVDLRVGFSKCRMFWTHDPDGNKIEVMELPPESMQYQANDRLRK
jgi:lactoylglutathione lyase